MVYIVVALSCEARPIVKHFGLKAVPGEVMPIYESDYATLIVCGIGKLNAGTAAGWLEGRNSSLTPNIWMNVGVCGHRNLPQGTGSLVHKVTDHALGKTWYPSILFETPCVTRSVRTVNSTEKEFQSEDLYEMEASGFINAAMRFSTAELVHCFKIVSDNLSTGIQHLQLSEIEKFVAAHLETLSDLIEQLKEIRNSLSHESESSQFIDSLLTRFHFTTYEKHQLVKIMRRIETLAPGVGPPDLNFNTPGAGDVLKELIRHVDSLSARVS
ncbi:MAG: hypothetical protein O2857_08920 [Planctomycetota bacterium]|nr:hypothetical protein [Planctomycetota bacterium]